jgi:hypothetical protein
VTDVRVPSGPVRVDPARTEWRQVGDEVVILSVETGRYLALNRSGSMLWPALVEGADPAGLALRLREAYGLDELQAAGDVAAFIEALRELDVIEEIQVAS